MLICLLLAWSVAVPALVICGLYLAAGWLAERDAFAPVDITWLADGVLAAVDVTHERADRPRALPGMDARVRRSAAVDAPGH